MKAIADTGFIVAFLNRNDRFHDWAKGLAEYISDPLLTCEAVLAEAAFHVRDCNLVLNLLQDGMLLCNFDIHENLPHLRQLAKRYADRTPDLADLCLIRMSELHPKHSVITVDHDDFRVYRRNRREAIPLICPQ
jgi:predicted nucleic acid-binding protein